MAPARPGRSWTAPTALPSWSSDPIVANTAWADARNYFERGPIAGASSASTPQQRARFLALAGRVALSVGRQGHPYFLESARRRWRRSRARSTAPMIELAERLLPHSGVAAMEFIKSTPDRPRGGLATTTWPRWQDPRLGRSSRTVRPAARPSSASNRLEGRGGHPDPLLPRRAGARGRSSSGIYCKRAHRRPTSPCTAAPSMLAEKRRRLGRSRATPPRKARRSTCRSVVEEHDRQRAKTSPSTRSSPRTRLRRLEFHSFRLPTSTGPGCSLRATCALEDPPPRDPDQGGARHHRHGALLRPLRRPAPGISDLFTIVEDTRVDATLHREYARRAPPPCRAPPARPPLERRRALEDDARPCRPPIENLVRASLDCLRQPAPPMASADLRGAHENGRCATPELGSATWCKRPWKTPAEAALRVLYEWIRLHPQRPAGRTADWSDR